MEYNALVYDGKAQPLQLRKIDIQAQHADQVAVELVAAGINRRDFYITKGLYPGLRPGVVLGSDGAGYVEDRAVILNPGSDWGSDMRVQDASYEILGMPQNGTFAPLIYVQAEQIFDKPAHLSMQEAAVLPLGGMTAYRALVTKGQVQPGDRVLINGIGGGVATMALKFALALGAEVYVTSSSKEKINQAIELGAQAGFDYTVEQWEKILVPTDLRFDVIIDSAGGEGFNALVRLAAPGARIAVYGGTRGAIKNLNTQLLFWRQISILGSTMATADEFERMLQLVQEHEIVPVVDAVFALSDYAAAWHALEHHHQFGKLAFNIAK